VRLALARARDPSRDHCAGHGAFAEGLLYNQGWLLIFGAIFLDEEPYETRLILLALRAGAEDA